MASSVLTIPLRLRPIGLRVCSINCRTAPPLRTVCPPTFRFFSASHPFHAKKYTKDHEWVEISEDKKTAVIGISNYAAHALGDVVYVELPTKDREVVVGDSIGAVESVKSASDINAPVSCKITAVNELLEEKPGNINTGPEDASSSGGWFAKVELGETGIKDSEGLMDADEYTKFTKE